MLTFLEKNYYLKLTRDELVQLLESLSKTDYELCKKIQNEIRRVESLKAS